MFHLVDAVCCSLPACLLILACAAVFCAYSELGALEREAVFYGLPELAATCTAAQQHTGITSSNSLGIGIGLPGALMEERGMTCSQQYVYDSLYLETGFSSIEGTGLREMEARKV